jgi:hypothetical protein
MIPFRESFTGVRPSRDLSTETSRTSQDESRLAYTGEIPLPPPRSPVERVERAVVLS